MIRSHQATNDRGVSNDEKIFLASFKLKDDLENRKQTSISRGRGNGKRKE